MLQIQITETGEEHWELTRVTQPWPKCFKYDLLARVVREDGMYYVERCTWRNGEREWHRQVRGYQIPRGALRAASDYALGKVGES